mmetsp:Transcript_15654/g.44572  ORF Transcript_15654/g.44572 Transcript_15654/m.44572 type:complete len:221 (+) Transcript_15654:959-1621(+)
MVGRGRQPRLRRMLAKGQARRRGPELRPGAPRTSRRRRRPHARRPASRASAPGGLAGRRARQPAHLPANQPSHHRCQRLPLNSSRTWRTAVHPRLSTPRRPPEWPVVEPLVQRGVPSRPCRSPPMCRGPTGQPAPARTRPAAPPRPERRARPSPIPRAGARPAARSARPATWAPPISGRWTRAAPDPCPLSSRPTSATTRKRAPTRRRASTPRRPASARA